MLFVVGGAGAQGGAQLGAVVDFPSRAVAGGNEQGVFLLNGFDALGRAGCAFFKAFGCGNPLPRLGFVHLLLGVKKPALWRAGWVSKRDFLTPFAAGVFLAREFRRWLGVVPFATAIALEVFAGVAAARRAFGVPHAPLLTTLKLVGGTDDGKTSAHQGVLQCISDAGDKGMTSTEIVRSYYRFRSLSAQKREELIAQLVEDGDVVEVPSSNGKGNRLVSCQFVREAAHA